MTTEQAGGQAWLLDANGILVAPAGLRFWSVDDTELVRILNSLERKAASAVDAYEQGYKDGESSLTADVIAAFDDVLDLEVTGPYDAAAKVKGRLASAAGLLEALQRIADRDSMTWPDYEAKWGIDSKQGLVLSTPSDIARAALAQSGMEEGDSTPPQGGQHD